MDELGSTDLDRVARDLVADGVAPVAAVGVAARVRDRWEISVGTSRSVRDVFDLASLTKPMTAMAIARAGLDRRARLGDVLPEVSGTASADATIEELLAHRAGLEAHVELWAPLLAGRPVDRLAALRRAADARRASREPLYSDLGFVLAGEALARHAGTADAGEAIERLVVAPLGLEGELGTARSVDAARVVPTEVVAWRGGEVRGVVHDENAFALTGEGGSGHAGMFGTCRAVLVFAAAADDAIVRREGPLAAGDLGWLVAPRPGGALRAGFDGKSDAGSSAGDRAGPRTYGHLGFTGTSFWIDPDAGRAVCLLTNRVHPTRENTRIRAARPAVHDVLWQIAADLSARAAPP